MFALGDALDDAVDFAVDSDPLLAQLHGLAVQIHAQRAYVNSLLANVSNADAAVDWDQLTTETDYLATLVSEFHAIAAQRTAQNPYALNLFDQGILAVGNWAQGVLNALPNAVSAIPNAMVNALANVVDNAVKRTKSALSSAALGLLIPGAIVLVLLFTAEKTRTYRAKVA